MRNMSEECKTANECNQRRKIKIINNFELLPSKTLLHNLIFDFKNKMQISDALPHGSDEFKCKAGHYQDKQRSISSSRDYCCNDIEGSFWQKKQRSHSISCSPNPRSDSKKIIVLQDIIIKSPLWGRGDKTENETSATNTKYKRSVLNDFKRHFSRKPPNSAPVLATTKFEFNFDNNSKISENFYIKKSIDINRNNVCLHTNVYNTENSSVHLKNNLHADNQNLKIDTTTDLRKNYFNIHQDLHFNVTRDVNISDSNTSNDLNKCNCQKHNDDLYTDKNGNIVPTETDQRKNEKPILQRGHDEAQNYESETSSKYISSTFNEAFCTNSSIYLDSSRENLSPVIPSCVISKDVPRIRKIINQGSQEIKLGNKNIKINTLELPYVGDIYNMEYLDEIFANLKLLEKEIVLQDGFLNNHNSDAMCRAEVVNWMLKIQRTKLCYSESEFYLAVYMLDNVLANVYIPVGNYQLLAVSTIWISIKLIGTEELTVSTMANLTKGVYPKTELLKMEELVLKIMNFELYTVEPSICIWYYLKLFNLEKVDLGRFSAFYALDFFALLPQFSSIPMSLLAAAVINFVQNIYHEGAVTKIHTFFQELLSKEDIRLMNVIEKMLFLQLRNMTDENYPFKEPYRKYKSESLMSISKYMHGVAFKYNT